MTPLAAAFGLANPVVPADDIAAREIGRRLAATEDCREAPRTSVEKRGSRRTGR